MFVAVDLSTVAFAQHFGHKPLAGFILGTYALGSATGGLWYGSRHWRAPAERRFALTLVCTVAGVATFWAQPDLITLTLAIYFCGFIIDAHGARWGYVFAACCGAAGVLTCLLGLRRLREPGDGPARTPAAAASPAT
jgi:hypothetical protein